MTPPGGLRVLSVGAGWPPTIFIARRLQALADAGANVSVLVPARALRRGGSLPGLTPAALSAPGDLSPAALARFGRGLLALLLRQPGEAVRRARIARRYARGWKAIIALWRAMIELTPARPDIVHFEWNSAAIDHEWMFDLFDCPKVLSCRGRQVTIWPHLPGREAFAAGLRRTFARVDAAHCVSAHLLREAVACGLAPEKGCVIPTAVDPAFHCPPAAAARSADRKPVRIVMVGALIWRKGGEFALLALRRLLDRQVDVCLDMIGRGEEEERLRCAVADLRLTDRACLPGAKTPEEVRDALQAADIFLLASLSEGIANAAVEAMACGLPVVTTDCGGMREAIKDGVEGLVVPCWDVEAMADALARLAADPALRRAMGRRGRERAQSAFSPERQAKAFLALYARAISARQEARG